VTRFKPGDAVYGTCDGSFAQYACTREDRLAHKPANIGFDQAAAVPVSAVTALQALQDVGRVQPGHKVLIIGAAGGVGTYAVQLAKAFGAVVTGVCSTGKLELVRSIGAHEVIDYTREDFADRRGYYDLILDIAGNRTLAHLRAALAPKGTLVLVGGEGGGRFFGGIGRTLRAMLLSIFVSQKLRGLMAIPRVQDLDQLTALIEAGELVPVIERTYPLAAAADAIRHMSAGHARGKLVVAVEPA
jgi:NADPH:quinone reductase-like Zn-dependent oxidoreductase